MPAGLAADIMEWCDGSLPKVIDDLDNLLSGNRIFKQRTVDIGVATREEALGSGVSAGRCCAVQVWRGIYASRSLMMFTRDRFRHPGRQDGRLLCALSRAHGGDARIDQDHEAVP
jgi:hypothetical protein